MHPSTFLGGAVLLLLLASAAAQGGAKTPPSPPPPPPPATHGNVGGDEPGEPDREAVEDELNATRARGGSKARGRPSRAGGQLFTATAYLRPRRLARGETGVLHVVVALGGRSVVVPGSVAELKLTAGRDPLEFGAPVLQPPAIGKRATKFRGRPVYDDTLLFAVPITIRPHAADRAYPIQGVVRLSLHDGSSGLPLGEFTAAVSGSATVGASLAISAARPAARIAATRSTSPGGVRTSDRVPLRPERDAPGTNKPSQDSRGESAPAESASSPGSAAPAEYEDVVVSDSRVSYQVVGSGIVAVLVVLFVLLLLRRR